MITEDLAETVDRLHRAADGEMDRAARARRLALELTRRRTIVGGRLDECRVRHTAEVWSSAAADRSRQTLTGGVDFSLWLANERLHETVRDLTRTADRLEDSARRLRFDAVEADTERTPPIAPL